MANVRADMPEKALEKLQLIAAVRGLSAADIFIADDDILATLKGQSDCQLCPVQKAPDTIKKATDRVIVMCRDGERKLCAKLSDLGTKAQIFSFTYDLLPQGIEQGFIVEKPEVLTAPSEVFLYLLPYGGDIPYILKLLANVRKVSAPSEILADSALWWLGEVQDFSLLRFTSTLWATKKQGGSQFWLSYDALLALHRAAGYSQKRMRVFFDKFIQHILYFNQRNKCQQAAMLALMEPLGMSSLWDMPRKQIRAMTMPDYSFKKLHQTLRSLVVREAEVEHLIMTFDTLRMVTVEELVESPAHVLEFIASLVGGRVPRKLTVPDYGARYQEVVGLLDHVQKLRSDTMDSLGVEKNIQGSLETETQRKFTAVSNSLSELHSPQD